MRVVGYATILLCLAMTLQVSAQPAVVWDTHREENGVRDQIAGLIVHPDNYFMVAGMHRQIGAPNFFLWAVGRNGGSMGASGFIINNFPDPNWPNEYPSVCMSQDVGYVFMGTITYDDRSAWRGAKFTEYVEDNRILQDFEWGVEFYDDQPTYSSATSIIACEDGTFAVAGILARQGENPVPHIIKLNADGELLWAESIDQLQNDSSVTVSEVIESEGSFVVCGSRQSEGESKDAWLALLDSEGGVTWLRNFDFDQSNEEAKGVIELHDGGLMVVGVSTNDDEEACLVLTTDNEGQERWHNAFSFGERRREEGSVALELPEESGYIIGGTTFLSNGTNYGLLFGIDFEGNLQWHGDLERRFDSINSLIFMEDNRSTMICGSSFDNNRNSRLMRVNLAPQILDQEPSIDNFVMLLGEVKRFSVTAEDLENDRLDYQWLVNGEFWTTEPSFEYFAEQSGEFEIRGIAADQTQADTAVWQVRVNRLLMSKYPQEDTLHMHPGDSAEFSVSFGMPRDSLDGFCWMLDRDTISIDTAVSIIFPDTGWSQVECRGYRGEVFDFGRWTVRTGDFDEAGDSPGALQPVEFGIRSIHPNPFNSFTQIEFGLDRESEVYIDAMDLSGRVVERLIDGKFPTGSHSVEWNATNATAGIYLLRMEGRGLSSIRKVVLVK